MAYWNGTSWARETVAAPTEQRTPSLSRRIKPAAFVAVLALALATTSVLAAPKMSGNISVGGPVSHGDTTMATVNPGGTGVYVFTQCWTADGAYVYAAYSPVASDNTAVVGPLWSTLWMSGGANCKATEGYFTRNGFGKWVASAQTSFAVQP